MNIVCVYIYIPSKFLGSKLYVATQDIYKQLTPRRCATITQYAPLALLRVADSLHHNHTFCRVSPCKFLVNWATMAAPIVNKNDILKIVLRGITFIQNILRNMRVTIYIYSFFTCPNDGWMGLYIKLWALL